MCIYVRVRSARPDAPPLPNAEPEEHLVFLHNLSRIVRSEGRGGRASGVVRLLTFVFMVIREALCIKVV